jgi:hypothetical protein
LGSCFFVEVDGLDFVFVTSVVFGPPQCTPGYGYGQRPSPATTDVTTAAESVFEGLAVDESADLDVVLALVVDAADFADERLTRRVELGSLLVTIVVLIVVVRVELLSLSSSWRLSTAIERESFDQSKDLARAAGRLVGTMTITVLVAAMLIGVGVGVRADGVAELNGATGAAEDAGAGL